MENDSTFRDSIETVGKAVDVLGVAVIVLGIAVATLLLVMRARDGVDSFRLYRQGIGPAILLGLWPWESRRTAGSA